MPFTPVRWTMPFCEMKTRSWCSRTISAPASMPFFSVRPMVFTPMVPRPFTGYSSMSVRLPYPASVTTSSSVSGRTTSMAST